METQKKKPACVKCNAGKFPHRDVVSTQIDWLQLQFIGELNVGEILLPGYELKDTYGQTKQFAHIYELFNKQWRKCTIVNTPKSPILNPLMNLVKMDNRELYFKEPVIRLMNMINWYHLQFKCISRIDLCIDFNEFHNGLLPETLIRRFMSNTYLKKGISSWVIFGKQKKELQNLHYLRFSSKESEISTYLYNKSRELKEVKNKPYIVNSWKAAGLDLERDVWRLEFSIHGSNYIMKNKSTGEYDILDVLRLDDKIYLNHVLDCLINQYFSFYVNTNIKKKDKMPKLFLFNQLDDQSVITKFCETKDSGKSEKIFLNKLKDLNNELRSFEYKEYVKECTNLINYYKHSRDL
jgi:hypothetical protein